MTTTREQLTPTAQRLLDLIAAHGGESAASNGQLAAAIDAGLTAVKDALVALEDGGFITVDRRRRNRHVGDTTGRTLTLAGGAA